jgi:hypothetical protein
VLLGATWCYSRCKGYKRRGIELAPMTLATMALKGLLREYVEVHGPESLIPKRKEPFTQEEI